VHSEDVDLIDIVEASAGRRTTIHFSRWVPEHRKCAATLSLSATRLAISVLRSVKASRKGPAQRRAGTRKLARSYLAQCVQVAGIDRVLHQTPDKRLVLFGRH
jgi:phage-related baseplate assembly protein